MSKKYSVNHIQGETMHNVIVDMISDAIKDIQESDKIDKDKIDILSGLIFEHIFHRTHTFVSDELDEFRAHTPRLDKHQKYIEWSLPIVSESDKIIKKLKQIGVIFSILFTLAFGAFQLYGVVKNYYKFDINIRQVEKKVEKEEKKIDKVVEDKILIKDTQKGK